MVQLSHPYMTTGKTTGGLLPAKWHLCFNTMTRSVMAFLPRSKPLLIWWLQSPSTTILEPKKNICHCFHFSPFLPWSDRTGCHDLHFFEYWVLSQLFHSHLSPLLRGSFVPPSRSVIKIVSSAYLSLLIFFLAMKSLSCFIRRVTSCQHFRNNFQLSSFPDIPWLYGDY